MVAVLDHLTDQEWEVFIEEERIWRAILAEVGVEQETIVEEG